MHAGGPACTSSQTCCPAGCFDLTASTTNCGGCGKICDAATTNGCAAGTCTCKPGYASKMGDPLKCVDINECLTNNGGCSANATCTNTAGGRTCSCNAGYMGDGVTCTDINECTMGGNDCDAHASCTNTVPGFSCACNSGWTGNGVSCSDINECATNNGGCGTDKDCTNTPGSYSCACHSGLQAQGASCVYEDCGSGWTNMGLYYTVGSEIHQTICGCIPSTAGAVYGSNAYWGFCNSQSSGCTGYEAQYCWTHYTGANVGDPGAPSIGPAPCNVGWENIGSFSCDGAKQQHQTICDCLPLGYGNPMLWSYSGGCYSHVTGRVGAPWCP
jgi:hypothetical protein